MSMTPMEFLRAQQESKLRAAGPVIEADQRLLVMERELDDARREYDREWKKLTTGKDAKWSEDELVASGVRRPVKVPAKRASSSQSRRPEGKPEPASRPPASPPGE